MKALISVRREERPRGYFLETDQSGINVFNLMLSPVNTVITGEEESLLPSSGIVVTFLTEYIPAVTNLSKTEILQAYLVMRRATCVIRTSQTM